MMKIFCLGLIYLLVSVQCATYLRLDSNGHKTLNENDFLISTLGTFRMTLKSANCKLQIERFDISTRAYKSAGVYQSPNISANCQSLSISNGTILTNTNSTYLTISNVNANYSTLFTIDDEGVIRLVGTNQGQNLDKYESLETVISDFKVTGKYVRAFSQLLVGFGDRFEAFSNEREWKFVAEFGQLTIYYAPNPSFKIDYVYSQVQIKGSRIYDFDSKTFPGVLFTNITFQPRCAEPKNYLEFKAPYVFVADPYWPSVSVYDQGGYKIIELSFAKLSQMNFNQNITEIYFHHFFSHCPRRTFEHQGGCYAECPVPYYHQIKGETGKCVLNCEEYSKIDSTQRTCGCVTAYEQEKLSLSDLVIECPSDAKKTPFGCKCTGNQRYYDGKLSFRCVSNCPEATYSDSGVCMECPEKCLLCTKDANYRLYLECTICEEGYKLHNGQCVPKCRNNLGESLINGTCMSCKDKNCVDCSNSFEVCLKCGIMTSLSNGTCVDKCSLPALPVYSENFSTKCLATNPSCFKYLTSHYRSQPYLKCDECPTGQVMHLDQCVGACPVGYTNHNGYCSCSGQDSLTIGSQCLVQEHCPITMHLDIRSNSCLSCPFGCITCYGRHCTSCSPGYFLYISPQIILCRRKSPLLPCDKQYEWQRDNVCVLKNFADPQVRMTLCQPNVGNCQVCIPTSIQVCILCREGFHLLNNECLLSCPSPLIAYQNACILPEIDSCAIPHLLSLHQQAVFTLDFIEKSDAYKYYIYNDTQKENDPVGYIPYYQKLTSYKRTHDGWPRQTDFFIPTWTCLKCEDGFGLNNDSTLCQPCPNVCPGRLCYRARADSCIMVPTSGEVCGELQYIDSETGRCLESCSDGSKFPQLQQGKLYCKSGPSSATKDYLKIDSAVYSFQDQTNLVFFVFNSRVVGSNQKVKLDLLQGKLRKSYSSLTQSTGQIPVEVEIMQGEYLAIDEQSMPKTYGAYQLNFTDTLLNLKSEDGSLVLPNKVYGSRVGQDHRVFMQSWLVYIGYIMSVVILVLHFVFIGMELLYKMDNLIIFVQSIFYFCFAKNLVGRLLAQFYYGWSFMHAAFLPNIFRSIIPDHYVELSAPASFKLVNMDGNYFRNAGFSLGWLLIYCLCWAAVTFGVWVLYILMARKQIWYHRMAKQALFGGIQFFLMNLMFFSVTQLSYGHKHPEVYFEYFEKSQVMAIITLVFICLYTFIRLAYNPLAGIYTLKRILIALVLAFSYDLNVLVVPIIFIEIFFAFLRIWLQQPQRGFPRYSIFGESVILIGAYFLLFFSLDGGVNTILISVIVFIFLVYLAYDLTTIYLESRNEYLEQQLAAEWEEERVKSENTGLVIRSSPSIGYPNSSSRWA